MEFNIIISENMKRNQIGFQEIPITHFEWKTIKKINYIEDGRSE